MASILFYGRFNDLLDASEAEDEELKLNTEPVQIEEILKESVEFLKKEADEKDLYLKLELPSYETKKILADPERVRGVVDNLIDNAIHYTVKGGVKVKLEMDKNNDKLIILIQDTGIGITEKEQKKLFKKFSRGKRASEVHVNGSDLGYIV